MPKLHVKKGDLVQVIAGKDKGAKGLSSPPSRARTAWWSRAST